MNMHANVLHIYALAVQMQKLSLRQQACFVKLLSSYGEE